MIQVKEMSFSYTERPFLENIDFQVGRGEIFGFLGPSGAGKSTLQKILTGLIGKYEGSAFVNGTDMRQVKSDFYEQIGVDFEFPSLYEKLTAMENLKFFSSLYKAKGRNPEELLHELGLYEHKDKKIAEYSKGMKSRLNFAKALIHDPAILFLDEPTSGLDPSSSRRMKEMILEEKSKGKTIILTTHNMADATQLCDRVTFIVDGKMKALDTPHNLIMSRGATKVTYTYKTEENLKRENMEAEEAIEGGALLGVNRVGASPAFQERSGECFLGNMGSDEQLATLISQNRITSIHSSEPTLEDIFVEVTGCKLT